MLGRKIDNFYGFAYFYQLKSIFKLTNYRNSQQKKIHLFLIFEWIIEYSSAISKWNFVVYECFQGPSRRDKNNRRKQFIGGHIDFQTFKCPACRSCYIVIIVDELGHTPASLYAFPQSNIKLFVQIEVDSGTREFHTKCIGKFSRSHSTDKSSSRGRIWRRNQGFNEKIFPPSDKVHFFSLKFPIFQHFVIEVFLWKTKCLQKKKRFFGFPKFVYFFLTRYRLFEKAFRLAIDLNDHDLFMDIHFYALVMKDMEMATAAKEKAQTVLSRSNSCSSSRTFFSFNNPWPRPVSLFLSGQLNQIQRWNVF